MADKALQKLFETFANSKDGKVSADEIKKLFKDSKVIGKDTGITEDDVDNAIGKASQDKKGVDFDEFKQMITNLAKEKKMEPKQLMEKLTTVPPTKACKQGADNMGAKCAKDGK